MKTVLLHGLGQTAQDWKDVVCQLSVSNVECPELFSSMGNGISYSRILANLERQYSNTTEPLHICGLSLGALLALDFTIRHVDKVASLVLIGAQYKVPTLLIDFQNILFRCMPAKSFDNIGLSKSDTIKLSHSMRSLDFTSQLHDGQAIARSPQVHRAAGGAAGCHSSAQQCVPRQRRYGCGFGHSLSPKA